MFKMLRTQFINNLYNDKWNNNYMIDVHCEPLICVNFNVFIDNLTSNTYNILKN